VDGDPLTSRQGRGSGDLHTGRTVCGLATVRTTCCDFAAIRTCFTTVGTVRTYCSFVAIGTRSGFTAKTTSRNEVSAAVTTWTSQSQKLSLHLRSRGWWARLRNKP